MKTSLISILLHHYSRLNRRMTSKGYLIGKVMIILASLFVRKCWTLALPHAAPQSTTKPWDHPCTPYSNTMSSNLRETSGDTTLILNRLTDKTQDTFYHVTYLQKAMATRFKDSEIVASLQTKTLFGFPEISSSQNNTQNKSDLYSDTFVKLSKVAVFLEQIYNDEDDKEMKNQLEDLQSENFSQLCELQMWLNSAGVSQSFETLRSLMPVHLRQVTNTFKRYKRDFIVIFRYGELLRQYRNYYN